MQFKKLIYTSLCLLLFNTISIAETIDKNEFSETQAVIESQLKAFINKDAEGAWVETLSRRKVARGNKFHYFVNLYS